MPLTHFICPDGSTIPVAECLADGGCPHYAELGNRRCMTRDLLRLCSHQRTWTGIPSTTQLISGTMCEFLKLTENYAVNPRKRWKMVFGSKIHSSLEGQRDDLTFAEERVISSLGVSGILDCIECETIKGVAHVTLIDYKTQSAYAAALKIGRTFRKVETGEFYKSGKHKGEAKTHKEYYIDENAGYIERADWRMQLNGYRLAIEENGGFVVDAMRVQLLVRDTPKAIATYGLPDSILWVDIQRIPDEEIREYFSAKKADLAQALEQGHWETPCTEYERWNNNRKCEEYCDVASFCPFGRQVRENMEYERTEA